MIDGHDHETLRLEAVHQPLAEELLDRGVDDNGELLSQAEAFDLHASLVEAHADLDVVASLSQGYLNSMHV